MKGNSAGASSLPTYPFERQRYWIDARAVEFKRTEGSDRAPLADWFYVPAWKETPVAAASTAVDADRRWLLFADAAGVAARVGKLRSTGGRNSAVPVVVEAGTGYARHSDTLYTINPGRREDYVALFSDLRESSRFPDVIGHFWGVDAGDEERGFYSLLYLAQAVGETGVSTPVRLGVVTTGLHAVTGDESLQPSKATSLGPVRVISQEYPNIQCQAIDVVASEALDADGPGVAPLVDELNGVATDRVVAYRGGRRWVQRLDPVHLEPADSAQPSRLRDRGVYLVTGGLGGVGLTLAEYLARTVAARLILIGRNGLPDRSRWSEEVAARGESHRISRQIRSVEALERAGAEVMVAAADVAEPSQIRAVVEEARRRFGRIDGVIHAAGVAGGGIIQLKDRAAAARVLAPKVAGTQALGQALEGLPLDFFVLCSSTTALFGGGGQVDYCAANAYLDAFAREYARRTGTFTVSIGWDAWRDVGMAVDTTVPGGLTREREALLARGIAPARAPTCSRACWRGARRRRWRCPPWP